MSDHHPCTAPDCAIPTTNVICHHCAGELVETLRRLAHGGVERIRVHTLPDGTLHHATDMHPGLCEELDTTLTRQHKIGKGVGIVVRAGEKPVPFHEAASEIKWVLDHTIDSWAGEMCRVYTHITRPAPVTAQVALWLSTMPSLLAEHPLAGQMYDEITYATREVWRVIDRGRERIYAGPCDGLGVVQDNEQEPCLTDLVADPEWTVVTCQGCGRQYDVTRRRQWMMHDLQNYLGSSAKVSLIVATMGVTISAATIRKWVQRGKIKPRAFEPSLKVDGQPSPLYRVGDVIEVAAGGGQQSVITAVSA